MGVRWNCARSVASDRAARYSVSNARKSAVVDRGPYANGVQYMPVTDGYLVDLSKNGERASGVYNTVQFTWHAQTPTLPFC